MSRFKELRRIEEAITNEDKDQLLWGMSYCKSRIKIASAMGLSPKAAKRQTRHWEKVLGEIEHALNKIG